MLFTIENFLTTAEVAEIARIIKHGRFVDGAATGSTQKQKKNNLELEVGIQYAEVVEIYEKALDRSKKFSIRILPRYRTNPIINRYDAGMHYVEHIDLPVQGNVTQVRPDARRNNGRTP